MLDLLHNIDFEISEILCASFCNGSIHNLKLFKNSRIAMSKDAVILADSGCHGIAKKHQNSTIPFKKNDSSLDKRAEINEQRTFNKE